MKTLLKQLLEAEEGNNEFEDDVDPSEEDIEFEDSDDLDDSEDFDDEDFMDFDGNEEDEDPDRQGLIRVVPGAHLVYKRVDEDGTFEELWIYNIPDSELESELEIRRAILAGTDIPRGKTQTEDGVQSYEMWTAGNAQMVKISGLPS